MRIETERLWLYPISNEEMRQLIEDEPEDEMKQAYTESCRDVLIILKRGFGMQYGSWNLKSGQALLLVTFVLRGLVLMEW